VPDSSVYGATASSPYVCSAGTYSLGNTTYCTSCPSGYFSNAGASVCSPCLAGTYSAGWGCYPCSVNYYSVGAQASCVQCPAGTYAVAQGSSACSPAPAGYISYYYGNMITCTGSLAPGGFNCFPGEGSCPAGQIYQYGIAACINAPAGYYNPLAGSVIYYICPQFSYSVAGSTTCTYCAYAYQPGSVNCPTVAEISTNCGSGLYGAGSCVAVPAGYYKPLSQASSYSLCPPNTYSLAGSSSCTYCPSGQYAFGGSSCLNCLAGTYSSSNCLSCAVAPMCARCSSGYYSTQGSPSCAYCPSGQYSRGAGSSTCLTCQSGFTSYGLATTCQASGIYSYAANTTGVSQYCSSNNYYSASPVCFDGYSYPGKRF
jgi:hypothetical protein